MKHISKAEREKQVSLGKQKEEAVMKVLQFSKKRFKRFDEVITGLYEGEDFSPYFSDRRIAKIHEVFNGSSFGVKKGAKELLKKMFIHLSNNSIILSGEEHIQAVCNMAHFRGYWLKDFFQWKPVSKRAAEQLKELGEYLFCKYAVPRFLHKAFFEQKNHLYINWFIHIGRGGRAKDINDVPFAFTQKMGHHFLQAPEKFSIAEALRWAQVKGMGGNDKLADRIAYSWLSVKPYDNEDFWSAFLGMLINGGMFNENKVTELIDYVREMKREHHEYNLKGRTLNSLLRQSDEWHNRFSAKQANHFWKPCGIEGLRISKKNELIVLEELTEFKALAEEGRTMKHCVSSYSFYCAKGRSAIFSLRKYADGFLQERLATIEVNMPLRRVVQAKAKANTHISDDAKKYMMIWVDKEELTVGPYL
jgi:PcfJ-like protein